MLCSRCEREIPDASNYCSFCGTRQRSSTVHRRLTRSTTDAKIAGVCGGIAEYLDIDPTLVRIVWVILSVVPGGIAGGGVAYLVAWLIIPKSVPKSPDLTASSTTPIQQVTR